MVVDHLCQARQSPCGFDIAWPEHGDVVAPARLTHALELGETSDPRQPQGPRVALWLAVWSPVVVRVFPVRHQDDLPPPVAARPYARDDPRPVVAAGLVDQRSGRCGRLAICQRERG